MKRDYLLYGRVLAAAAVVLCLSAWSAFAAPAPALGKGKNARAAASSPSDKLFPEPAARQFPVPPPPFTPGIFPCSECHKEMKPNTKRRTLTDEHTNIVLNHAQGQRWCLDCHDTYDRDKLHLVNGQRISFEESYRLCGQCHGDKYRDWKVGVHGKRTGMWNGEKQYLLCVNCHNPHDPRFKALQPMPPPVRPGDIR
ncbi:MAG: cytochrome c3 family protein [Actinomycetota bacterium]